MIKVGTVRVGEGEKAINWRFKRQRGPEVGRLDRREEPAAAAISQLTGAAESGPAAPVPAESSRPVPVPAAATLPVPPVPPTPVRRLPKSWPIPPPRRTSEKVGSAGGS